MAVLKKEMKKLLFCFICLFFSLILTSCDLLNGSLAAFIDDYTNNAAIMKYEFNGSNYPDASGTVCIARDSTVSIFLRNPKNYNLSFSYTFKNNDIQNYYETNYASSEDPDQHIQFVVQKADNSVFEVIFPEGFLFDVDNGIMNDNGLVPKDISGTISVVETATQRPFESFDIALHVDTIPEAPVDTIFQLDNPADAQEPHYIVCFTLKNLADTVHQNDMRTIRIGSDVWMINSGDMSVEPVGTPAFTLTTERPEALYPLTPGGQDTFPEPADGYTAYYYITDIQPSENTTTYPIVLSDAAGLSASRLISNYSLKLGVPHISIADVQTQIFTTSATTGTYRVTISHDRGTVYYENGEQVSGTPCSSTPTIYYTVKQGDEVIFSGNKAAASINVEIPSSTSSEGYTIEAYATCNNYLTSATYSNENAFKVKRHSTYFVSETGDNSQYGTATSPYRSIQNAINEIIAQKEAFDPDENGYTINVLSNITPDEDFLNLTANNALSDQARYLINMSHFDASGNPQTPLTDVKLTIRGSDANGNAANRTINAQGSAENSRMLVRWGGTNTLTLENLTLTGGYYKEDNQYCPGINLDASQDQTLTVTLNNVTITGNTRKYTGLSETADMTSGLYFYGGYSFSPDSILTLNNCTVSGNTSIGSGKGAAVTFRGETGAGKVILKGKNIIQNNVTNPDTDNTVSNVYLPAGKMLTVESVLSSGSRIGVTTANQPAVGEPIPFVDGWQASYGQPANFFTSDTGCGITTDDSDIPVLAVNSGTGSSAIHDDVSFTVSSDFFKPGEQKKITLTAEDTAAGTDITSKATWTIRLYENGDPADSSWYTVSGNTITLKPALPESSYTLYADIIYNGRHYSHSVIIAPPAPIASLTSAPASGYVSASTASDFAQLATWVSGGSSLENVTILLDSDVTITGSYTAIGTGSTRFKGTFDGQGHTVNINSQTANAMYYGLFGDVYGGTIKNVTVTGSITASGGTHYIGGIAGELSTGTIENCINNVTISGAKYAGGIVGFPVSCTIKNCLNNASVSGTQYAGGIGGSKNASAGDNTVIIINCVNNGNVTTSDTGEASGGITGHIGSYTQKLSLSNTANTGVITKNSSPSSEIYGGNTTAIKELKNVIYLQNSGSGTFSYDGTLYSASSYAAEIHAETTLSAIVSRLNSWINSQPAAERATYRKWKVSGTKIVFEDEE